MDVRNILQNLISNIESITADSIKASTMLKEYADTLNEKTLADGEMCCAVSRLQDRCRIVSREFYSIIEDLSCLEPPVEITWIGEKQQKLDMVYSHGRNPWEFYLTSPNRNECLDEMNIMLRKQMDQNLLKRYQISPKEGDFVVAREGKKFHRSLVLKYNPKMTRASILIIDLNKEGFVQLENIYKMPSSVSLMPCQTMKCCLNVDDKHLDSLWCKDLEIVFKSCLTDGILTVDVLKKVNSTGIYPLFHIRLYVYNEDLQQEINFSSWVNYKVLVHLKNLNGVSEEDAIMSALDDECWNPFYITSQNSSNNLNLASSDSNDTPSRTKELAQASVNENIVTANSEKKGSISLLAGDVDNLDEPDPNFIDMSVLKVSNWMEKYTDEDTIIYNRKAAAATRQVVELKEPSFSKSKKKPESMDESKISGYAELSQAAVSAQGGDQCQPILNISGPKAKASTSTLGHSSVSSSKKANTSISSKMSPTAPEFIPSCDVEITPGANEESYEGIISNLEEEYQPMDEQRLCLYFQKTGVCRRRACTKEHIQRNENWTNDKAGVEVGAKNDIDLPKELSETVIWGQHAVNGISFYSTLHELYSETNEHGPRETLESLYEHMNSLQNSSTHPLLTIHPALGEEVLALGLQRTLGPKKKWLRARVVESLDENLVEVFFLDFGNKEIVRTTDLRQIRPQFLHLPHQAVLTTLASIEMVKGKEKKAKKRLQELIKGKLLKAKVINRNIIDAELEVILFTEDHNNSVNNLLVDEDLCLPY